MSGIGTKEKVGSAYVRGVGTWRGWFVTWTNYFVPSQKNTLFSSWENEQTCFFTNLTKEIGSKFFEQKCLCLTVY